MPRNEISFRERYGPWALVLGAGQGLGLALAGECRARGLDVGLVDADAERLATARAALGDRPGGELEAVCLDLGSARAGARLAEWVARHELGLGIYTAALTLVGPFLSHPLEQHRASVRVNCEGALTAAWLLGRALRERGRGGLVLFSSLAGFQGNGWVASYAASKAFDLVLAESLGWELRPHGVDVLAVAPGSTDTPGFRAHQPRIASPDALQDPAEVARETLDALGGPCLLVPGAANRVVHEALEALPRAQRVNTVSEQTRALYERDE